MATCSHLDTLADVEPSDDGCHDCLLIGGRWVHLRMCQQCGHVGCCDNSPNRHATAHYHETAHPLIRSFEPDEEWFWCYADARLVLPRRPAGSVAHVTVDRFEQFQAANPATISVVATAATMRRSTSSSTRIVEVPGGSASTCTTVTRSSSSRTR